MRRARRLRRPLRGRVRSRPELRRRRLRMSRRLPRRERGRLRSCHSRHVRGRRALPRPRHTLRDGGHVPRGRVLPCVPRADHRRLRRGDLRGDRHARPRVPELHRRRLALRDRYELHGAPRNDRADRPRLLRAVRRGVHRRVRDRDPRRARRRRERLPRMQRLRHRRLHAGNDLHRRRGRHVLRLVQRARGGRLRRADPRVRLSNLHGLRQPLQRRPLVREPSGHHGPRDPRVLRVVPRGLERGVRDADPRPSRSIRRSVSGLRDGHDVPRRIGLRRGQLLPALSELVERRLRRRHPRPARCERRHLPHVQQRHDVQRGEHLQRWRLLRRVRCAEHARVRRRSDGGAWLPGLSHRYALRRRRALHRRRLLRADVRSALDATVRRAPERRLWRHVLGRHRLPLAERRVHGLAMRLQPIVRGASLRRVRRLRRRVPRHLRSRLRVQRAPAASGPGGLPMRGEHLRALVRSLPVVCRRIVRAPGLRTGPDGLPPQLPVLRERPGLHARGLPVRLLSAGRAVRFARRPLVA
jgi:hypothetical protein